MKKTNIILTNPCNKNWDKMTPNENGRHCISCNKNVIDFTKMNQNQILEFLNSNKNDKICGKILDNKVIVKRPTHHQYLIVLYQKTSKSKYPLVRPFFVSSIFLIMFLVGCNRPSSSQVNLNIKEDTLNDNNISKPFFMGSLRPAGSVPEPEFYDVRKKNDL